MKPTGNKHFKRLVKGCLPIIVISSICYLILVYYFSQIPLNMTAWPQETVDYTYVVPASATILEGKADVADIFGDHTLCISFKLSSDELQKLRQQRMSWFSTSYTSSANWRKGRLTDEELDSVSYWLKDKPDPDAEYSFIREELKQLWWAAAINEDTEIIYYCRASW
jgi:hypothetical protein